MQNSSSHFQHGAAFERAKAAYEQWSSLEDKKRLEASELQHAFQEWTSEKKSLERALESIGKRYAACTFDSYEIASADQQKVVDALREYASNAKANIEAGRNVILVGPKGTGKDHLLVSLAKACFMEAGVGTRWVNGMELLNAFHYESLNPKRIDYFDADPNEVATILYISDPVPPTGALSESKLASMFRLVDARYRSMRPTWISMNVADGAEAEARLGSQAVDRLRHGALVLFCNWDSHRKAAS